MKPDPDEPEADRSDWTQELEAIEKLDAVEERRSAGRLVRIVSILAITSLVFTTVATLLLYIASKDAVVSESTVSRASQALSECEKAVTDTALQLDSAKKQAAEARADARRYQAESLALRKSLALRPTLLRSYEVDRAMDLREVDDEELLVHCRRLRIGAACHEAGRRLWKDDPFGAHKYYERGCNRGYGPSCRDQAFALWSRKNADDNKEAITILQSSCEYLEHGKSCRDLGYRYRVGRRNVVEKDVDRSYSAYKKGCMLADIPSCEVIFERFATQILEDPAPDELRTYACGLGVQEACVTE